MGKLVWWSECTHDVSPKISKYSTIILGSSSTRESDEKCQLATGYKYIEKILNVVSVCLPHFNIVH